MLLGQPLVQKPQDPLGVADDMMVCLDILVNLCPINVDLDDPCLAGKALRVQRDPVGEPTADGNQQIAAVAGDIRGLRPVHPDHTRCQRIATPEATGTHQGNGDRRVHLLGKLGKLPVCPAADNATAADQQRLFRLADHIHQDLHIAKVRLWQLQFMGGPADQRAQAALARVLLPGQRHEFRRLCSGIFYNVDQNRTRAAAPGDGERLPDDIRHLCRRMHHKIAFGDRHRDPGDIDLLEGILPNEVFRHVTSDKDGRGAVHIRGGDPRRQVRAAGTRCCEAHADLAGGPGVSVRCVGCALLMGCQNMLDLPLIVV